MNNYNRPAGAILAAVLLVPSLVAAQDADTKEVLAYVLTDAGLAKYSAATKKLAAIPDAGCNADSDSNAATINAMVARIHAVPGARDAIRSAGMTTREYVVFSWSLLQNGLAAWAVSQPGGKLPPGASKANVDFYKKHEAELQQLEGLKSGDCAGDEEQEGEEEQDGG